MQEKELIWVDKEQAKLFKDLETDAKEKEFIDKIIERRKIDITDSIECLSDDLIRLKSFTLTYKTELAKSYNDQSDLLEKLFEEHDLKITELKNKIKQLTPVFQVVLTQIKSINDSLSNVSTFGIERLIEMVEKVNGMSEADKELISKLINLSSV